MCVELLRFGSGIIKVPNVDIEKTDEDTITSVWTVFKNVIFLCHGSQSNCCCDLEGRAQVYVSIIHSFPYSAYRLWHGQGQTFWWNRKATFSPATQPGPPPENFADVECAKILGVCVGKLNHVETFQIHNLWLSISWDGARNGLSFPTSIGHCSSRIFRRERNPFDSNESWYLDTFGTCTTRKPMYRCMLMWFSDIFCAYHMCTR